MADVGGQLSDFFFPQGEMSRISLLPSFCSEHIQSRPSQACMCMGGDQERELTVNSYLMSMASLRHVKWAVI